MSASLAPAGRLGSMGEAPQLKTVRREPRMGVAGRVMQHGRGQRLASWGLPSCPPAPQVSANGNVLRSEIVGSIKMRVFLSGMPELRLGLNDKVLFDNTGREYPRPRGSYAQSGPCP